MFRLKQLCAFFALAFIICIAAASTAQAQAMSSYVFTSSSGTFTELSGATVQTLAGGNSDDGYYPLAPIGFNFKYNDVVYTQVSASTNGWMRFGTLADQSTVNNLNIGGARPLAAPLWDDLAVFPSIGGSVSYLTTGTSPNRVFTIQWLNVSWDYHANDSPVISFQVKLYETTNAVQFVYRQEARAVFTGGTFGASIGLTATATSIGNFISLSDSGTNPTASTTTDTNTIGTKPATGQTYTFTPPLAATAASVSIGGRVTVEGSAKGLARARVTLTDMNGGTRDTLTDAFGYYRFDEVTAGETIVLNVYFKGYPFSPQVISVSEDLNELNFAAPPRLKNRIL